MIWAAATIFSIVGVSSLYGQIIIDNPEIFNPFSYHVPMVWFDLAAISLLKVKPSRYITNPLVFILSLSIINHTFGAFSWASYNEGYMYDLGRHVVLGLELLVFTWGIFNYAIARRRKDHVGPGIPGILFLESDKCD